MIDDLTNVIATDSFRELQRVSHATVVRQTLPPRLPLVASPTSVSRPHFRLFFVK